MTSRRSESSRGFTLVEMMVVISIILILLGMAIPIYSHSVQRAKEENLRTNLRVLNDLIFKYTLDKQKFPQSLDDLKTAGYIKDVPEDITGNRDSWQTEAAESVILVLDQTDSSGIIGVHSGSQQIGSDGKPYSEW